MIQQDGYEDDEELTRKRARDLHAEAYRVARIMSDPDRPKNYAKEIFTVESIAPLSEFTAVVIYFKNPSEKRAAAFFYYYNVGKNPRWMNFFPTDSHIIGMATFGPYKRRLENENYYMNWPPEERPGNKPPPINGE